MTEDWIVVDKNRKLEARWIERHRKACKQRMVSKSRVRKCKSTATERKKVPKTDRPNRLTNGIPASEDIFTAAVRKRPSSAKTQRIVDLSQGDGRVELISTPRLMASLQGFVREHRSLRSVGLTGLPASSGALFRVGARAKVRESLNTNRPISTREIHEMVEEASAAVELPAHLQRGINEPTSSGPPLTFYGGDLF